MKLGRLLLNFCNFLDGDALIDLEAVPEVFFKKAFFNISQDSQETRINIVHQIVRDLEISTYLHVRIYVCGFYMYTLDIGFKSEHV